MRSSKYSKIETLFERDKETGKVLEDKIRRPEFGFIDPWWVTEKIDGTNIRLHFYWDGPNDKSEIFYEIGGRTDNAQMSTKLYSTLIGITQKISGRIGNIMQAYELQNMTIYGEGYGAGIGPSGGNYRKDLGLAVFDMLVDDVAWLSFEQVRSNCDELDLEMVPVIGQMTREMVVATLRNNFLTSAYGKFNAEGVVARPLVELRNHRDRRVQWKLKGIDF